MIISKLTTCLIESFVYRFATTITVAAKATTIIVMRNVSIFIFTCYKHVFTTIPNLHAMQLLCKVVEYRQHSLT
ncbi:MAG: hypothetical protein RLZZ230_133 [Candidatus Parcubacteria bacterium]|jgi:hypothetical protein